MQRAPRYRLALGVTLACVAACSGASTQDPSASGSSCDRYCTAMDASCSGENLKYISHDVCLKMCENIDPGADGDVTGDSQACRLHFALAATADPANNCEAAAPLGDGPCTGASGGDQGRCVAFCMLDLANCSGGASGVPAPYASEIDCRTACAAYAYTPRTRVTDDETQSTLNCRLYHLEAAYVDDEARVTHCPHTAQVSLTCTNH